MSGGGKAVSQAVSPTLRGNGPPFALEAASFSVGPALPVKAALAVWARHGDGVLEREDDVVRTTKLTHEAWGDRQQYSGIRQRIPL